MSSIDIENDSRHNKRRRWNGVGDISAATGNRDLAQKTLENEGFLSSDDDDEKKKKGKSQARKEQQLGMRSFHHRTAAKGNSNNIEEMSLGGGWTPSLPNNNLMERSNSNNNSNNSGRAYKTPRPPSNVSTSSGFTLSSVADNGGKNSNNKRIMDSMFVNIIQKKNINYDYLKVFNQLENGWSYIDNAVKKTAGSWVKNCLNAT